MTYACRQTARRGAWQWTQRGENCSIALVVTVIAIVLVAWYAASEPSGFAGYVLAIVTLFAVYAAALAIWDALESWFFDWTPFAVENMAYRWISSLEVHVALQTNPEAGQGTAANE